MDFLLECVGFPPDADLESLTQRVLERAESVPWRGPRGLHLRLPLAEGLELRLDQEEGQDYVTLWPHFQTPHRLRVAFQGVTAMPDSPYDVLLHGLANPPLPDDPWGEATGLEYSLATFLSDGRRLPKNLPRGHVLAVSISGFALDVSFIGPNDAVRDPHILEEPSGALLVPTAGNDAPGGSMDLSLRVRSIRNLLNPISGQPVQLLEVDAPGRPLNLFVSPWQLEADHLDPPRPGSRIEGTFLFTGRLSGGLSVRR